MPSFDLDLLKKLQVPSFMTLPCTKRRTEYYRVLTAYMEFMYKQLEDRVRFSLSFPNMTRR